jgi:hypothetical protein
VIVGLGTEASPKTLMKQQQLQARNIVKCAGDIHVKLQDAAVLQRHTFVPPSPGLPAWTSQWIKTNMMPLQVQRWPSASRTPTV